MDILHGVMDFINMLNVFPSGVAFEMCDMDFVGIDNGLFRHWAG